MLQQLGILIAVGTMLVIGLAASGQQGRWAAQNDEAAQSLVNMEREWAEADCDGNLAVQTILADDFRGRHLRERATQSRKSSRT